jgi:hypothetical protein
MKKKLFMIAILAASFTVPTAVQAIGLSIDVGDRGYYTHGARYWNGDWEYVWVPGHRWHGHWIHGHYVRGERRHHQWDRRHHHDDFRDDYRR